MMMASLVKRLVVGTRWEEPAKRVHSALTGRRSSLYDSQTIAIMRRVLRSNSTAVDIGAFEGGMLRHMFRFAPQGRHFAFEPLPDKFHRLKAAFPTARVYPYAVAVSHGDATFYEAVKHPALSGLRRREALIPNEAVQEIRVVVDTLDRVIPQDQPIAFVKVDVEGGELGVFRGGTQTLSRTRPVIVFECGLGGADLHGDTPHEIFDALTEHIGLKVFLLEDWLAARGPLMRSEFVEQFERSLNYYFVAAP